jgi:hypothetical protein
VVLHRIAFQVIRSRIIEPHFPRWRRRGWLAVIAGTHVLAFLCWQHPQRPHAADLRPHEAITYILAPLKPPLPPRPRLTPPERSERPARVAARTAPVAPAVQAEPITAPPVAALEPAPPQAITQTAPPPDPFALPVKPDMDLKQRAIAGAAAADKAALKESFTQRDRKLVNDETALATAIGKAYRGGSTRQVELIGPDGSRITKFILPGGGAVCYTSASNNFSGGRDPFRDTGRLVVSNCPQ